MEGNVLFNNTLNTFYLRLYGVGHMVKDDWYNKGRGMYYPAYGMMHIREPLLLFGKSSPCGGSEFLLSLSEWSFTICLTSYNRKLNVLNASLNTKLFLPCATGC